LAQATLPRVQVFALEVPTVKRSFRSMSMNTNKVITLCFCLTLHCPQAEFVSSEAKVLENQEAFSKTDQQTLQKDIAKHTQGTLHQKAEDIHSILHEIAAEEADKASGHVEVKARATCSDAVCANNAEWFWHSANEQKTCAGATCGTGECCRTKCKESDCTSSTLSATGTPIITSLLVAGMLPFFAKELLRRPGFAHHRNAASQIQRWQSPCHDVHTKEMWLSDRRVRQIRQPWLERRHRSYLHAWLAWRVRRCCILVEEHAFS